MIIYNVRSMDDALSDLNCAWSTFEAAEKYLLKEMAICWTLRQKQEFLTFTLYTFTCDEDEMQNKFKIIIEEYFYNEKP